MRSLFGAALILVGLTTLPAQAAPLLDIADSRVPNDTSGKVELSWNDQAAGAKALRAVFSEAGSFGETRPKLKDWSRFGALKLDLHNPSDAAMVISLSIKHAGTTGFPTRVEVPLELAPGRHTKTLELADLKNTNGSAPDLTAVSHWYLTSPKAATLFVVEVALVEGEAAAASSIVKPGATLPAITKPIVFNTPEADAVMKVLQIYPADNPWNEDISARPVAANSKEVIATMDPNRHLYFNADMGYVIVPADQKKVPVKIVEYGGESDPGPFPVPDDAPIEGWPLSEIPLAKLQREGDGDRHMILLDPTRGLLHEFFVTRRTDAGWQAAQSSTFDLKSNKLRPDGWTSSDAAGLPILPSVVRYDELERGAVEHALRFTAKRTRRAYVYPATHFASRSNDPTLPRMGDRFRLRADYDISGFSPHSQTVLKALKKYGMILADNGVNWAISTAPDARIKGLEDLNKVKGRDFELIVPTGPNEGPRARK